MPVIQILKLIQLKQAIVNIYRKLRCISISTIKPDDRHYVDRSARVLRVQRSAIFSHKFCLIVLNRYHRSTWRLGIVIYSRWPSHSLVGDQLYKLHAAADLVILTFSKKHLLSPSIKKELRHFNPIATVTMTNACRIG